MKAAGIDFGSVRIGLAVADDLGSLAHPRPFVDGRDRKRALAALAEFAKSENIEVFVLGLPRTLSGRESQSTRAARQFARQLQKATGLPVEMVDEWLSTKQALDRLRDQGINAKGAKSRVDSAAAASILQAWLDGRR